MDIATIIGLVLGFGGVFGGMMLEGGSPMALVNIPAFVIVIVGTIGVGFVAFPLSRMIGMASVLMKAFVDRSHDSQGFADELVSMADRSRKEGILSLEPVAQETKDEFLKKALMLMVDGTDASKLRTIMEIEVAAREERHEQGIAVLEALGGFAPTLGIMGTVLGLINVLSNLTDTSSLGHHIAGAFIATFYGVFSANVLFLPLGNKLKTKMKVESHLSEIALEGILAIQAGDNPRIVREKLDGFLSPGMRKSRDSEAAGSPVAKPAAA